MASSEKITILLADEDALRRDGLAAVLQANANFEVVAQCPDGDAAIGQIRSLRPDVAVVDLNLPKLHGIELVRRVRGEALGTKMVLLSGSTDEDIIREVVRAGGDGYLLKNGPARHLVDAISYVRDGGQYFSPQLRRDGLDRRLLEEPPRVPPESAPRREAERPRESGRYPEPPRQQESSRFREEDDGEDEAPPPRSSRDSRYGRAPRPSGRASAGNPESSRLRERIREDSGSAGLADRDYEILDMMAEGIRPILDRLDEIEGRVGEMESGETPVPGNVRGWLNNQIADTLQDGRGAGREVALGRSITELEARLPQLIEEAVTARFSNMATKLQQEIEETHLKTLETFVKNIQVKLVQRVSALETDMSKQVEAMSQLREYSQRTEDNLSRLISGVDKLAEELPRRLAAAQMETPPQAEPIVESRRDSREFTETRKAGRKGSGATKIKIFWGGVALVVIVAGAFTLTRLMGPASKSGSAPALVGSTGTAGPKPVAAPPADADTKTRMQAAEQATDRKEYSMAEDIYKQVLKSEPGNSDARKALASVLYREDKIEESAAELEKLPK